MANIKDGCDVSPGKEEYNRFRNDNKAYLRTFHTLKIAAKVLPIFIYLSQIT